MTDINIRRLSIADIDALQQLSRQTFFESFSALNTEENMTTYLREGFSAEKLTAELHNAASQFYFAELDGLAIGYLKINEGAAQTELKDDKGLEIERIYVSAAFQGKKIGQLLYDYAVDIALQGKYDYIWLGVWEENQKAIKFYKKNGFVEFDKHLFILGDDEQTDIMMKLSLVQ
jgi:ribosomal protein S18 acetylase RimI-like enzyme